MMGSLAVLALVAGSMPQLDTRTAAVKTAKATCLGLSAENWVTIGEGLGAAPIAAVVAVAG